MRLLHRKPDGGLELMPPEHDPPPYAILSHTWTQSQEVTYSDFVNDVGKERSGYAKIRFCAERAAVDGLEYFWVDTCCIDKSDSTELSTAINSMFRWYKRARKCYVYLPDVSVPDGTISNTEAWMPQFRNSKWFTRGWTLQEIVSPETVEFFSKEKTWLGSRKSLEQEIHNITRLPLGVLRGQDLNDFTVEERISWVKTRVTTVKEDKVYCLLGIFGIFLPLIYGEGEEYAMLRLREEVEKRQKGRGNKSLQDVATSMSLPFPRNERFVGREDELQALEKSLILPEIHRRLSIYGLGGRGKSALALGFAYRALAKQMKVFWVPAISRDSFELAYREIGIYLRIPGITDDNADVRKLVNEELSSGRIGAWLLIIDNVDDPDVLPDIIHGNSASSRLGDSLPHSNAGAILFTTRSRKVAAQLTPSDTLELNEMSEAESKELLKRRITKQELCQDDMANDKLLQLLTYLPLAIVQAAAFINNNNVDVSTYIEIFEDPESRDELFSELFEDATRYPEMDSTIARTWYISFDHLRKQDQLAAEYLCFMACIDRIKIPQSLLPLGEKKLRKIKAIGSLMGYAFISELQQTTQDQRGERFFDMHRLVHLASIFWLNGKGERSKWVNTTAARLVEMVPFGDYEAKEVWKWYLSHTIHVAGLIDVIDNGARAALLERIGRCQSSLGQYTAAEFSHRQSSAIIEKIVGPEHKDTLISMNNLALMLFKQGKQTEAEPIYRRTLAKFEESLGPEHFTTLTSKNQLAGVLERQGKFIEAELLYRRTLEQQERTLGFKHTDTLSSKNNLGGVLLYLGRYEEAERILKQTLVSQEEMLGHEHPFTLSIRTNLAGALQCQQKYTEAETILRPTLTLQERVLGLEHPDTMSTQSLLAFVLGCQAKYEEGEWLHRQVLAEQERIHGPKHTETMKTMMNLTFTLEGQNKDREAESMRRDTLVRRMEVHGPEHPDTLMTKYCLARILAKQGYYVESLALYKETYPTCVTALGENHPSTRLCHEYYSELLEAQKKGYLCASSTMSDSSSMKSQTSLKSKLSRRLATLGWKKSRFHPK